MSCLQVDELRAQNPNTILVDGGDMFHGTMWYYHFGGAMLANFMNLIGYEAFVRTASGSS